MSAAEIVGLVLAAAGLNLVGIGAVLWKGGRWFASTDAKLERLENIPDRVLKLEGNAIDPERVTRLEGRVDALEEMTSEGFQVVARKVH